MCCINFPMNKERVTGMVEGKTKGDRGISVLSCSTPEHRQESPSRDSDSLCDSDAASPVPFLCTQDGTEGITDVVWNFYTPKSEHAPTSRLKNSSLTRKTKRVKTKVIEKPLPKRRFTRATQKKTELFQDLIELNKNLHELITKNTKVAEKRQSGSEEDIFSDAGDSPKSVKSNSRCLRRNLLSSKFCKPETETALESDDSMNECLIKASQVVEENIFNCEPTLAKRPHIDQNTRNVKNLKPGISVNMDQDSMDAILNSIKLDSPITNKIKKCDSSHLNNDSFDSIFGNLNESALDRLTQMPIKNTKFNKSKDEWTVQEVVIHDDSFSSKSIFGRHNSMPESPTVSELNKPSTSGMALGRYNSMPYKKNLETIELSPSRCTPDEIKRKHQLAREKLLAKRLLPFTSTQQQSSQALPTQLTQSHAPNNMNVHLNKICGSQPKQNVPIKSNNNKVCTDKNYETNKMDIKSLIEHKRQEALMRLRKRQQNRI